MWCQRQRTYLEERSSYSCGATPFRSAATKPASDESVKLPERDCTCEFDGGDARFELFSATRDATGTVNSVCTCNEYKQSN